ncbi:MAG: adenylate kinase [Candidatus Dormibacteria bacterium]
MAAAVHRNLALFGPAGSGKGTQAELLRRKLGLEHIATGEMLRQEHSKGTELGQTLATYLDQGKLVPDEVIVAMIRHRLDDPSADSGFVLDGFPRTLTQARALEEMLARVGRPLDMVLVLKVPTEQLVQRLELRARQQNRADDTRDVIEERLRIYREQTAAALDYLAESVPLFHVDGTRPAEAVFQAILGAVS